MATERQYIGELGDIERKGGVDGVTVRRMARESNATTIKSIEKVDCDKYGADYRVELTVEEGFYASFQRDSRYRIKTIAGTGNPETVVLWVIERNY